MWVRVFTASTSLQLAGTAHVRKITKALRTRRLILRIASYDVVLRPTGVQGIQLITSPGALETPMLPKRRACLFWPALPTACSTLSSAASTAVVAIATAASAAEVRLPSRASRAEAVMLASCADMVPTFYM